MDIISDNCLLENRELDKDILLQLNYLSLLKFPRLSEKIIISLFSQIDCDTGWPSGLLMV